MASSESVVLNAYQLLQPEQIQLSRRFYQVSRSDGARMTFDDHPKVIDRLWTLRREQRQWFSGYGAPSSATQDQLALPPGWQVPNGKVGEYELAFVTERTVSAANPQDDRIILPLMSKAANRRLRDAPGEALGDLWLHFGKPTQLPNFEHLQRGQPALCRSLDLQFRRFAGNRVSLTIGIQTCPIDPWSLAQYYRQGAVEDLAEMLEAKRARRIKRDGRPLDIHVWCANADGGAEVVTLADPDKLIRDGALPRQDQTRMATVAVSGNLYKKPRVDYPSTSLHLILDTEDAGEFHGDTILSPVDRIDLMGKVRAALTPMLFEDYELSLAEQPLGCEVFPGGVIAPPPITIRTRAGTTVLDTGANPTGRELSDRARTRARAAVQHGFVVAHPVIPLLAVPARQFNTARTKRLVEEMERAMSDCGCGARFLTVTFQNVDEIETAVQQHQVTGALVVLPEHSKDGYGPDDTHERLKRKLSVPSQCVHLDHTQHSSTIDRSLMELQRSSDDRDRRQARRIRQVYEICVSGLLVKLANIPFVPAGPFHYNVHIGLDVGGVHNNVVVASMSYGLANPTRGLFFRCEKIDVPVAKAEPIPVDFLVRGLRELFASAQKDLQEAGVTPDFENVLIFRDGRLLGIDGRWNEADALHQARANLIAEGACTAQSRWTAVEVSKFAQGLKLFALTPTPDNVIVGSWRQLYDDPNMALVVTTGRPYLTQGTAEPAKLTLVPISGKANMLEVVRDFVWDADMSFTKPDMSLSLPWTLKIADQSALDYARTYRVSGITA